MTYPTVNNVVTDARGNPVPNATVVISLVGAPAFSTDVQGEIINSAAVYTDATGAWSTTLKPNALITPSGTYYLVQEPGGASWTIVVPNDTATHTLQSLLVVGPNPPAGLPGVVRYDQAQALSSGQKTQAQTNMGVDPTSLEALLDPRYLNQDDADIDTDVVELLNNSGSATATKLASQFAPFGETARAQGAESTNATAISNETARATAAEATKANDAAVVHLAGAETISGAKAFTAPPTVPTQSPLDNSTKAASTAYADAAVAVEKSRAQTFEASLPATYGQVVMHGSTAGTARPTTSLSVQWVGTVTPANAVNGDTYLNTTTGNEQVMVASAFQALNKTANDASYVSRTAPTTSDIQALATANATALRPWRAALANRDLAPAHFMIVGDSVSFGSGASTWQRTWARRIAPLLNKRNPIVVGSQPVGGRGFIPVSHAELTSGPTPTTDGVTRSGGGVSYGSGLGVNLQVAYMTGAGQTHTYALNGDYAHICLAGGSGQGVFSWKVDGGAATNIDASTLPAFYGTKTALIPLGTAGAHTLTLSWVSGTTYHNGVVEYNGDSASGIVCHNAALGGQDAIYYNGTQSNSGLATFCHAAQFGVSLIVVPFGINAANSVNRTPAQFQGDLTTLLSYIRSTYAYANSSAPLPSVVFIPEYQPSTITVTGAPAWAQYVAAVYAAAATDANCCVGPDLSKRFPTDTTTTPNTWFYDGYHPSDIGHAAIASYVAEFLSFT